MSDTRESRPVASRTATSSTAIKNDPIVPVTADVGRFAADVLRDCMANATRAYWLRRAEQFEAARPTPEDYTGNATRAELSAQWQRLTAVAQACRNRAELEALPPMWEVAA